jgi:hypothetical protein
MNIFKKVTVGALIVAFAFLGAVGVSEAASKISQSEARDIAEDYYRGNGELTEIVLENEDGDLVYEVEFTDLMEMKSTSSLMLIAEMLWGLKMIEQMEMMTTRTTETKMKRTMTSLYFILIRD